MQTVQARYAIDADTAPRLARAATRYRLARPAVWVPLVVEVVLGAAFAAAGHPGWGIALVAVAVAQPVLLLRQSSTLAAAMYRRGYRPGTVLEVEWEPETFTVVSSAGSATYPYDAISHARQLGSTVAMRIRGVRVLLLLPAEVVPADARPRLRLSPRP